MQCAWVDFLPRYSGNSWVLETLVTRSRVLKSILAHINPSWTVTIVGFPVCSFDLNWSLKVILKLSYTLIFKQESRCLGQYRILPFVSPLFKSASSDSCTCALWGEMPHDRTTSFFADYSFFESYATENYLADKVSHLLLSKNTVLKFSSNIGSCRTGVKFRNGVPWLFFSIRIKQFFRPKRVFLSENLLLINFWSYRSKPPDTKKTMQANKLLTEVIVYLFLY